MRYVWNNGNWIEYDPVEAKAARAKRASIAPMIWRDIPAYKSPLGDGVIEGRAARREHLKATGCREVDPSEWKPVYNSEKRAIENGADWAPKQTTIAPEEGTSFERKAVE